MSEEKKLLHININDMPWGGVKNLMLKEGVTEKTTIETFSKENVYYYSYCQSFDENGNEIPLTKEDGLSFPSLDKMIGNN